MVVSNDDLDVFESVGIIVDLLNRMWNSEQHRHGSRLRHVANPIDDDGLYIAKTARIAFADHIQSQRSSMACHTSCQLGLTRTVEDGDSQSFAQYDVFNVWR